jgi:hypothetical protein
VALEQDGPHSEDGLELLVTFLERGLMFVGLESVLQGERLIVGDEGKTSSVRATSNSAWASECECSTGRWWLWRM